MCTPMRVSQVCGVLATGLGILFAAMGPALAQTHESADVAASAATQPAAPSGGFLSSLKEAFKVDYDREVVRAHFDVGSAPDTHRFYCLVDPKTGKRETSGVAGQPAVRPDGMTGIKSGAVSFYSCQDAEKQGLLDTTGYIVNGSQAPMTTIASPVPRLPDAASGKPVVAPGPDTALAEITAVYARYITGENAHDRAVVSELLLDSKDFVWAQYGGNSIWGHSEAMDAFQRDWKGTWKLDPQFKQLRVGMLAPGVAMLITPVMFTEGAAGEPPATLRIRWSGVFLRSGAGWRIASIVITPIMGPQPGN